MQRNKDRVDSLLKGKLVKSWVAKMGELPTIEPKTVTVGEKEVSLDEMFYDQGRYGSPLAYVRLFDLAEQHGFSEPEGGKVFDFGYGSIGHF